MKNILIIVACFLALVAHSSEIDMNEHGDMLVVNKLGAKLNGKKVLEGKYIDYKTCVVVLNGQKDWIVVSNLGAYVNGILAVEGSKLRSESGTYAELPEGTDEWVVKGRARDYRGSISELEESNRRQKEDQARIRTLRIEQRQLDYQRDLAEFGY